jgi:aldehyde dehydrogenase (NAD+)
MMDFAESRMLIDGKLVGASSGKTFPNISPITEQVIGETADGTEEDFRAAIAAARRAFDKTDWPTNAAFRAKCLLQLQAAVRKHADKIRELLTQEVGMVTWLTRDTNLDVPIERLGDYAKLATDYPYEKELEDLDFRGVVSKRFQRREAMGVVAAILPWNSPWATQLMKLGPALAAGNTIIIKPSPDAPWGSTILGRIVAEETDIPPGVINVVTSSDNLMGEILTTDPGVDMIAFTGSVPNGRRIAAASAATLKRLLLELGGKSPYVVLESADVAKEAAAAATTICGNVGQGCVARSRLLLPKARYEEGIAAAKAAMEKVSVGDPYDPHTFMGPMISKHHRERVLSFIEKAQADGNRLVHGGGIPQEHPTGWYIQPTLFADVKPDDTIAREEIFGPVLAVIPYETEEEALEIANNSIFGLSASVVAATDEEAIAFANKLRTGTVSINGGVWMHLDVPFGGYKQSGLGRQFGLQGFEQYLETKVLGVSTTEKSKSLAWGEVKESEPA